MSTPTAYRKRPVIVEAIQWTGDNYAEIVDFLGDDHFGGAMQGPGFNEIFVITLEGSIRASLNDWIIRGTKGEHYPCKPDIFAEVYEPADAEPEAMREMASHLLTLANEAEAER